MTAILDFIHNVVHLEQPNYQHLWRQYTTKILKHDDAATSLMLVSVTSL
jgi:hypothetical protein